RLLAAGLHTPARGDDRLLSTPNCDPPRRFRRSSMPKCREVMTPDPVCCEPDDPVTRIASLMMKEDVGSVPVVESLSSKRLVGIVTDRDLVTKVVAGGRAVEQATARDAMTSNPASCAEDDEVSDAMTLMAQ